MRIPPSSRHAQGSGAELELLELDELDELPQSQHGLPAEFFFCISGATGALQKFAVFPVRNPIAVDPKTLDVARSAHR